MEMLTGATVRMAIRGAPLPAGADVEDTEACGVRSNSEHCVIYITGGDGWDMLPGLACLCRAMRSTRHAAECGVQYADGYFGGEVMEQVPGASHQVQGRVPWVDGSRGSLKSGKAGTLLAEWLTSGCTGGLRMIPSWT